MPKASVKRLIECNKNQLIDLVLDIEKYPEFVPFCLDAHVYEKNNEGDLVLIIADLTIGKGPFKDTYKSDVKNNKKNSSINVTNIELSFLLYTTSLLYVSLKGPFPIVRSAIIFVLSSSFLLL